LHAPPTSPALFPMMRRPARSTLFPYTTPLPICLHVVGGHRPVALEPAVLQRAALRDGVQADRARQRALGQLPYRFGGRPVLRVRSEEHTSELQSRENLVCRLLLEKKNTYQARHT